MTKTQIDKLGERLKAGDPTEADLRMLDEYRRSFGPAFERVMRIVREQLGLAASGRAAKHTGSIRDKLKRESIRLSQMQDIAGCRVTVTNIGDQVRTVGRLRETFDIAAVDDRVQTPSHGYRAVHVIVRECDRLVEIPVRTILQHEWAQLSERLADNLDPAIKYGGGPDSIRQKLKRISEEIGSVETLESTAVTSTVVYHDEVEAQRRVAQRKIQSLLDELSGAGE